ncbi:MAG: sulfurtransferase TusA family protein [Burkholderiales bacterium]
MSDRDGDSVSALHRVDLRGMRCPGPIVRLNTEFRQLATGTEVEVVASDPVFELDVKVWCKRTGHALLRLDVVPGEITAVIRRGA